MPLSVVSSGAGITEGAGGRSSSNGGVVLSWQDTTNPGMMWVWVWVDLDEDDDGIRMMGRGWGRDFEKGWVQNGDETERYKRVRGYGGVTLAGCPLPTPPRPALRLRLAQNRSSCTHPICVCVCDAAPYSRVRGWVKTIVFSIGVVRRRLPVVSEVDMRMTSPWAMESSGNESVPVPARPLLPVSSALILRGGRASVLRADMSGEGFNGGENWSRRRARLPTRLLRSSISAAGQWGDMGDRGRGGSRRACGLARSSTSSSGSAASTEHGLLCTEEGVSDGGGVDGICGASAGAGVEVVVEGKAEQEGVKGRGWRSRGGFSGVRIEEVSGQESQWKTSPPSSKWQVSPALMEAAAAAAAKSRPPSAAMRMQSDLPSQ
ncbi:hypothetical protein B0H12DRAFT_1067193 [Mycena haematopus]|nr:hypothetical protein B0H12DRAFT_1067193 [Mycena haematopus]